MLTILRIIHTVGCLGTHANESKCLKVTAHWRPLKLTDLLNSVCLNKEELCSLVYTAADVFPGDYGQINYVQSLVVTFKLRVYIMQPCSWCKTWVTTRDRTGLFITLLLSCQQYTKSLERVFSPPAAELLWILAQTPARAIFQRAPIRGKGQGHFIATPKDGLWGS